MGVAADRVYADHNATSPLLPAVKTRLEAAWDEPFANPSAPHTLGRNTREAVEAARAHVAELCTGRGRVVFTGSATEANASALFGHAKQAAHKRVVISALEHPSVLENAKRLTELGHEVVSAPALSNGLIDLATLERLLDGAGMCAVMWANNETGAVQPIAEIARLTAARGVRLHVDAVQAAGKLGALAIPTGVDTLSLSAHKLGGLTGAGALVVVERTAGPWLVGGGQEGGERGGTENLHGILAFGWAAQEWLTHGATFRANMANARSAFEKALVACAHQVAAIDSLRLPNTSDVLFPGVRAEALLTALDLAGVAASHGAACATGSLEPSHALLAMGFTHEAARSALRVSFGPLASEEEGQKVAEAVLRAVGRLRA